MKKMETDSLYHLLHQGAMQETSSITKIYFGVIQYSLPYLLVA